MITLDLSNDPQWLDLGHGVQVKVLPLTTALMVEAREDTSVSALQGCAADEAIAFAMAKALARLAILDWDGVGDMDGAPLAVSPDAVDALLDVFALFEAFQLEYVTPGLQLEQEKNASASSPSGTSAGAPTTAPPAPRGAWSALER